MWKRLARTLTLWLVIAAAVLAVVGSSPTFQKCVHDQKNADRYQTLKKSFAVFQAALERRRIDVACTGIFANENSGSLTFIVGLLVLGVYWRQAGIMEQMRAGANRQTEIMDGQLKATQDAAVAAQMQAKKAILDMRAAMTLMFPIPIEPNLATWDVVIRVKNTGRASGTMGDTFVRFLDELPTVPVYDTALMQRRGDFTLLEAGATKVIYTFISPSTKEGQFCYGFYEFYDDIGRWRRRFCVQIRTAATKRPEQDFFSVMGGEAYNGEDFEG